MIFLYIFLILLAAFPLVLTALRMKRAALIKKEGIHVNATITHIRRVRIKTTYIDFVDFEYRDRNTGKSYSGKATSRSGKYKYSDRLPVAYLPGNPSRHTVTNTKGGYTGMLIFCILLFLFVLFAVYKIDGMVSRGEM